MNNFEYTQKNQALSAIRRELAAYADDKIVGKQIRQMESQLIQKDNDEQLKVAVCGQYSSGKSTLVHALTNDDTIAIGQDVTTDKIQCYEWEGMKIADTPGIYAGREEHDALSLDFIKKADLLIYMITIQGFTREIGMNFKKLILEKYADKTMLVMNKRNQEPAENEPNWRKDVVEFLGNEELIEKFYFSIIDIEDYLTGVKENIPELIEESHFNDFLGRLNAFVRERELMGRVVSKVNIVDALLTMYIEDFSHFSEKDHFTKRQKNAVQRAIVAMNKVVREEGMRMRQEVKDLKYKLAGLLTDETLKEFKVALDNAEIEMQKILDSSVFESQFKEIIETLEQDMQDVEHDALDYEARIIDIGKKFPNIDVGKAVDLSAFKTGLGGISKALKSVTKDGLIKFVHFFKGKFKPWGAVKCMKWVKAAGPVLSVLGNVIDFVQLAQDRKHQQELENARQEIISSFGEIENNICSQLEEVKNADGSLAQILNQMMTSITEREKAEEEERQHKQTLLEEFKKIKEELDTIL